MKPEETKFGQRMQRVETLVDEIENTADPALRAKVLELVQTLMDFHGAGIGRMMDITANVGAAGYAGFDDFARDDLVSSLLLLYDLHARAIEDRGEAAIEVEDVIETSSNTNGFVQIVSPNKKVYADCEFSAA